MKCLSFQHLPYDRTVLRDRVVFIFGQVYPHLPEVHQVRLVVPHVAVVEVRKLSNVHGMPLLVPKRVEVLQVHVLPVLVDPDLADRPLTQHVETPHSEQSCQGTNHKTHLVPSSENGS